MVDPMGDGGLNKAIWLTIATPEGGGTHMRITRSGDRWVVSDVYVHGSEVTASDLQSIPISQMDLFMNLASDNLDDLESLWSARSSAVPGDASALWKVTWDSPEPTFDELKASAENAPNEIEMLFKPIAQDRPKLTRPDGSDPDGFYLGVARAYAEYAPRTRAPAIEIANEAGVPVGTARGWVREARRRGHLRPGRQGKVG